MFNKFFNFFTYPPVVISICAVLTVGTIILGVTYFVDHSDHPHYIEEQAQITQAQEDAREVNPYRAYEHDTRIDENYEPTWDDDPILYMVNDGEDIKRTPEMYIREWTPWGNPDIRCVTNSKHGGVACFPTK